MMLKGQYDEHCYIRNPRNGYTWKIAMIDKGWVRLEQLDGKAFHIRRKIELAFMATGSGLHNG